MTALPCPAPTWVYAGAVTDVHDGDTITVNVDLGFSVDTRQHIRFLGINAPELSTPEGKAARDYLVSILPVGSQVVIQTAKLPHGAQATSFDRYVAAVWGPDGKDICAAMVDSGHAVAFTPKLEEPA